MSERSVQAKSRQGTRCNGSITGSDKDDSLNSLTDDSSSNAKLASVSSEKIDDGIDIDRTTASLLSL